MKVKSFKSFKDASLFAQQHANEIGESVRLERDGDGWVVILSTDANAAGRGIVENRISPSEAACLSSWWEVEGDEERKREERGRIAFEAEVREREMQQANRKERGDSLEEREKYYRALSLDSLYKLWESRAEQYLEADETALIRDILRGNMGLTTIVNSPEVCSKCFWVLSSCTCKRHGSSA